MRVVDLVSQETGVGVDQIMLLRHSTESIDLMEAAGVSVEEYTSTQPPKSKWDFWHPDKTKIDIVVVIVRDRVDSVFRVLGVEAEGNFYSIVNEAFRKFDASRGYTEDRQIRRFELERIPCTVTGVPIAGWERKEISAVLRSSGNLFWQIEFAPHSVPRLSDEVGTSNDEEFVPQLGDRRQIVERQICERRGQQRFREQLRQRYGDRCLITDCKTLAVLEAAHISPYRGESDNHPENGLLLRSDVHTLLDLDLLGIDPAELKVILHPDLAKQKDYANLAGTKLRCPPNNRPSQSALDMRYEQFRAKLITK